MIIKKGKEKAPEPTPEPTPVPTPEPAPAPEPVAEDTYTITYTKVTCIHKAGEEDYYHKGYYVQVEGTMSGPVGSYVTTPNGMGDPKCGWSKCTRQAGDPETSTWTVTLPSRAESWWYAIGIEKQGDLFYRERTDFSDICLQSPPPAPVDTCDTNAFNRAWMDCNHNSCSQPYQDCANSIPSDASNYYELDHQCALQQCECYKQCGADLAQQMGCLDHYKPSSCN
jgi:hypothetical protein